MDLLYVVFIPFVFFLSILVKLNDPPPTMSIQPPSEGEVSVTSGILGSRLHKWKNNSTVSEL